ncbi:hypothetical protein [Oceanobacillus senegalensis]|uniref:hypothetical protein n=1 Tax=Oceanobacillus senegalensis TaxID=1936063 RepID=UPI000A3094AC|nr:hypothetical protein [Oceanobacillus senegalensis]
MEDVKKDTREVLSELEELSKRYDQLYEKLHESNKTRDHTYTKRKHIRYCIRLFYHFIKNINFVLRWVITLVPVVGMFIPSVRTWVLNGLSNPVGLTISISSIVFLAVLLIWWIDRTTILKVTNVDDESFHIGAFEKYRNNEYKRLYSFYNIRPYSFQQLAYRIKEIVQKLEEDERARVLYYIEKLEEQGEKMSDALEEMQRQSHAFREMNVQFEVYNELLNNILLKLNDLNQGNLQIGNMRFIRYYTIHYYENNVFLFKDGQHPRLNNLRVNYENGENNFMDKALDLKQGQFIVTSDQKKVIFTSHDSDGMLLIITLYASPGWNEKNIEEYGIIGVEDEISLWYNFLQIMEQIETKGDRRHDYDKSS